MSIVSNPKPDRVEAVIGSSITASKEPLCTHCRRLLHILFMSALSQLGVVNVSYLLSFLQAFVLAGQLCWNVLKGEVDKDSLLLSRIHRLWNINALSWYSDRTTGMLANSIHWTPQNSPVVSLTSDISVERPREGFPAGIKPMSLLSKSLFLTPYWHFHTYNFFVLMSVCSDVCMCHRSSKAPHFQFLFLFI